MKIDNLIAVLQRVREEEGNREVAFSSFCGTNNGHVLFRPKDIQLNKRFKTKNI